jgi:hypothetical protein
MRPLITQSWLPQKNVANPQGQEDQEDFGGSDLDPKTLSDLFDLPVKKRL